jgi:hypothetical protein
MKFFSRVESEVCEQSWKRRGPLFIACCLGEVKSREIERERVKKRRAWTRASESGRKRRN